ncbi:hypothetical protein B6N60_04757 [Richelia sinica FACHB-800]|uniref:Uncharacterized protein n=1 Tax=Richelia sinica FACHB-800 TaxID=1357546 RepID=A0A975TCP9_9NOST|nr:hypothetical protein B6N60_04757 [Richelia sinica FACHB-800]
MCSEGFWFEEIPKNQLPHNFSRLTQLIFENSTYSLIIYYGHILILALPAD